MAELQRLTVEQLRRQSAYAGVRSINGKSLKYARRSELIAALERHV